MRSWESLLREEGLCTPTLFYDFKKAVKFVDVKVFGVYASAAIAKLKVQYRRRVVRSTQEWIDTHQVPPTYQRISKYVTVMRKELGIRPASNPLTALRLENNRLKRELSKSQQYCELLQATLKKNNIRVPKEPA